MSSHGEPNARVRASTTAAGSRSRGIATEPEVPIEEPSLSDALGTVFGLHSRDLATYDAVAGGSGTTTEQLSTVVDRDRSNVHRSLSRLERVGLVSRRPRIPDSGGLRYEYSAVTGEAFDRVVEAAIERWTATALAALEAHDPGAALGPGDR